MPSNFYFLAIVVGFIAVVIISVICLCVNGGVEGDWKKPSTMRYKRKHRPKLRTGGGSFSCDLEYCENEEGGMDIELQEQNCGGDSGGGCENVGGDDGECCNDGG